MKAVKVVLSDGREVLVREPRARDFSVIYALPSLQRLAKIFESAEDGLIRDSVPRLSDEQQRDLYRMIADLVADPPMTVEEVAELSMTDFFALVGAVASLFQTPKA
jgi:hypothetical protein